MIDAESTFQTPMEEEVPGDHEQTKFIVGERDQITIRPSSLRLENLNNTILSGSRNNMADCNGASSNNKITNSTMPCTNNTSARTAPNNNGTSSTQSNKKPIMSLTHLSKRPPADIEFKNLTYRTSKRGKKEHIEKEKEKFKWVTESKPILNDLNGKFKSGQLTAIMGPSGAGKSTLMNVLAGYKTSHLNGTVLINGKERNLRKFRKMSCYIMQDDQLLPHLTVREAMMVSASLRLEKHVTMSAKKVVIEEIIKSLGLSEASNVQTQNLSGGQKKRLSIALELINNPPLMFFDEPTSGLDSSSCFQCLSLLKSLSRGGRTIICTIHQPSARLFEMFDHLYVLAEGQCMYQGSIKALIPFLSSMGLECPSYHNPADYVIEVASGDHGEYATKLTSAVKNGKCGDYQRYQTTMTTIEAISNEISKETPREQKKEDSVALVPNGVTKPISTGAVINIPDSCTTSLLDSSESLESFSTSSFTQFWILLKRTLLSQMRDTALTKLRFISHVVMGILIGAIYYKIGNDASEVMGNAGCIFFTVMFLMFTAMMPTVLTFPLEIKVFVREHLNYWYSLKSFYFAKTLVDLPFQTVYSLVYVSIVYFMTGQPLESKRFLMYLGICLMVSLVAQSLGLLIGAGMNVENGSYFGPVMSVPIVLFSGFFVKIDAIPFYLKCFTWVSYTRYGFEGAMVAVYGYNRAKLHCSEVYCQHKNPTEFLKFFSMQEANYWFDFTCLTVLFIITRFGAYFVLRLKLRSLK